MLGGWKKHGPVTRYGKRGKETPVIKVSKTEENPVRVAHAACHERGTQDQIGIAVVKHHVKPAVVELHAVHGPEREPDVVVIFCRERSLKAFKTQEERIIPNKGDGVLNVPYQAVHEFTTVGNKVDAILPFVFFRNPDSLPCGDVQNKNGNDYEKQKRSGKTNEDPAVIPLYIIHRIVLKPA
jgi:hypothetical protein